MYKKFDGYDFSELYEAWGLYIPKDIFKDSYYLSEFISNFVVNKLLDQEVFNVRHSKFQKRAANDIRIYLAELSKYEPNYSEIWEVLSKMENDLNMTIMFSRVCGYAWC